MIVKKNSCVYIKRADWESDFEKGYKKDTKNMDCVILYKAFTSGGGLES